MCLKVKMKYRWSLWTGGSNQASGLWRFKEAFSDCSKVSTFIFKVKERRIGKFPPEAIDRMDERCAKKDWRKGWASKMESRSRGSE